ncbi:unnamed protein product [Tilletia caries]|nr:unnamed protein product [Tilletia caries]
MPPASMLSTQFGSGVGASTSSGSGRGPIAAAGAGVGAGGSSAHASGSIHTTRPPPGDPQHRLNLNAQPRLPHAPAHTAHTLTNIVRLPWTSAAPDRPGSSLGAPVFPEASPSASHTLYPSGPSISTPRLGSGSSPGNFSAHAPAPSTIGFSWRRYEVKLVDESDASTSTIREGPGRAQASKATQLQAERRLVTLQNLLSRCASLEGKRPLSTRDAVPPFFPQQGSSDSSPDSEIQALHAGEYLRDRLLYAFENPSLEGANTAPTSAQAFEHKSPQASDLPHVASSSNSASRSGRKRKRDPAANSSQPASFESVRDETKHTQPSSSAAKTFAALWIFEAVPTSQLKKARDLKGKGKARATDDTLPNLDALGSAADDDLILALRKEISEILVADFDVAASGALNPSSSLFPSLRMDNLASPALLQPSRRHLSAHGLLVRALHERFLIDFVTAHGWDGRPIPSVPDAMGQDGQGPEVDGGQSDREAEMAQPAAVPENAANVNIGGITGRPRSGTIQSISEEGEIPEVEMEEGEHTEDGEIEEGEASEPVADEVQQDESVFEKRSRIQLPPRRRGLSPLRTHPVRFGSLVLLLPCSAPGTGFHGSVISSAADSVLCVRFQTSVGPEALVLCVSPTYLWLRQLGRGVSCHELQDLDEPNSTRGLDDPSKASPEAKSGMRILLAPMGFTDRAQERQWMRSCMPGPEKVFPEQETDVEHEDHVSTGRSIELVGALSARLNALVSGTQSGSSSVTHYDIDAARGNSGRGLSILGGRDGEGESRDGPGPDLSSGGPEPGWWIPDSLRTRLENEGVDVAFLGSEPRWAVVRQTAAEDVRGSDASALNEEGSADPHGSTTICVADQEQPATPRPGLGPHESQDDIKLEAGAIKDPLDLQDKFGKDAFLWPLALCFLHPSPDPSPDPATQLADIGNEETNHRVLPTRLLPFEDVRGSPIYLPPKTLTYANVADVLDQAAQIFKHQSEDHVATEVRTGLVEPSVEHRTVPADAAFSPTQVRAHSPKSIDPSHRTFPGLNGFASSDMAKLASSGGDESLPTEWGYGLPTRDFRARQQTLFMTTEKATNIQNDFMHAEQPTVSLPATSVEAVPVTFALAQVEEDIQNSVLGVSHAGAPFCWPISADTGPSQTATDHPSLPGFTPSSFSVSSPAFGLNGQAISKTPRTPHSPMEDVVDQSVSVHAGNGYPTLRQHLAAIEAHSSGLNMEISPIGPSSGQHLYVDDAFATGFEKSTTDELDPQFLHSKYDSGKFAIPDILASPAQAGPPVSKESAPTQTSLVPRTPTRNRFRFITRRSLVKGTLHGTPSKRKTAEDARWISTRPGSLSSALAHLRDGTRGDEEISEIGTLETYSDSGGSEDSMEEGDEQDEEELLLFQTRNTLKELISGTDRVLDILTAHNLHHAPRPSNPQTSTLPAQAKSESKQPSQQAPVDEESEQQEQWRRTVLECIALNPPLRAQALAEQSNSLTLPSVAAHETGAILERFSAALVGPEMDMSSLLLRALIHPSPYLDTTGLDLPSASGTSGGASTEVEGGVDVLEPPYIIAGCQGYATRMAPAALKFWDKLGLSAVGGPKHVAPFVLQLDASDYLLSSAVKWLERIDHIFQLYGLGSHVPNSHSILRLGDGSTIDIAEVLGSMAIDTAQQECWEDTMSSIFDTLKTHADNASHIIIYIVGTPGWPIRWQGLTRMREDLTYMARQRLGAQGWQLQVRGVPQMMIFESGLGPLGAGHRLAFDLKRFAFAIYDSLQRAVPHATGRTLASLGRRGHGQGHAHELDLVQYPAFTLAPLFQRHMMDISLRWPLSSRDVVDRGLLLHVGYELRAAHDCVVMTVVDQRGQLFFIDAWTTKQVLVEDLATIWLKAVQFARRADVAWRFVLCKTSSMPMEEILAWSSLERCGMLRGPGILDVTLGCVDTDSPLTLLPTADAPSGLASGPAAPNAVMLDASSFNYALYPSHRFFVPPPVFGSHYPTSQHHRQSSATQHQSRPHSSFFDNKTPDDSSNILALASSATVRIPRETDYSTASTGTFSTHVFSVPAHRAAPHVLWFHILQVYSKDSHHSQSAEGARFFGHGRRQSAHAHLSKSGGTAGPSTDFGGFDPFLSAQAALHGRMSTKVGSHFGPNKARHGSPLLSGTVHSTSGHADYAGSPSLSASATATAANAAAAASVRAALNIRLRDITQSMHELQLLSTERYSLAEPACFLPAHLGLLAVAAPGLASYVPMTAGRRDSESSDGQG